MSRPCAFCGGRADCACSCRDEDGVWVRYEPWCGSYETKKESEVKK